jgi:hypothetical protein
MKKILFVFTIAVLICSCRSIDFPSVEESQRSIDINKRKIDSLNTIVESRKPNFSVGSDLTIRVSLSALNKIVEPIANSREEDVAISFHETKPLFKEDKSIFGIAYTNYLNVESGNISANLKKFRFDRFEQNKIDAIIELEGKGNIAVSGRYMGVPASSTPLIELYLYEPVSFGMIPTGNGSLQLKPIPKKLILKTKTSIKLLEWYVPWYQEIPLELTDLIQPVTLPLGFKTEVGFPLPSSKNSNAKIEYVPYLINLSDTQLNLINNKIEFKTNIDFVKKTNK